MRHQRGRRRGFAVALVAIALGAVAGCGGEAAGPPVLNWYINPDSGGQETIAQACTQAAGGAYTIAVSTLPRESSEQRQQLIRRLAANDSSIDLMSLDPPYVPEFAEARFLAPLPDAVKAKASQGVVQSAVEGATWNGELVALPFWANTQLLWYRKSAVAATGLDMTKPVTWDQIITAAQAQGKQVAAQGRRAESLTVWVNALIESAGGKIITDPSPDNPANIGLGLEDPPATEGAQVIEQFVQAGVGGPGFSTASEDTSATAFENGNAIFMVNWPFVYTRAQSAVEEGTLPPGTPEDYGWALYPQVKPDLPSAPPLGGIDIAVGAFTEHPDLAFQAAECITSPENQAKYWVSDGNPAASIAAFSDPAVVAAFPMAETIKQSLEQAAPRPQTPYYAEVSESIQRVYHPPSAVNDQSGAEAAALIRAVLAKEDLL
ncbi:MAG: extracellular solute-binding protein [Pseudonocardia sp.]